MDAATKAAKIAKETNRLTSLGMNATAAADQASKSAAIGKSGAINPYGLAATVVGTALGAATGPSKEYGGRYGSVTKTMDTIYDGLTLGVNFVPGWG
jgi:hypothetical protein